MNYVKDVTRDRLGLDFDTIFRHLAPSAHAPIGLEELRTIFFGGYMDAGAEEAPERVYDEVRVRPAAGMPKYVSVQAVPTAATHHHATWTPTLLQHATLGCGL